MQWSDGKAQKLDVRKILIEQIPACIDVKRANEKEDRSGTDWWAIRREPLRPLSVDLKARQTDPTKDLAKPKDDLALETWSVIPANGNQGKVGWTRDEKKSTDYILWLFDSTSRWVLIPFHMLCKIFKLKWEAWRMVYQTNQQDSGSWKSECVFVPRREIWAELYKHFGGSPNG